MRLSGGRPQVLRPVDQTKIGQRSSQLTTLVRVAETELGLGGSPDKKQRTTSPVHEKSPEKREEMETVVSPPEEVLAIPLQAAEEGEILSDTDLSEWITMPTSSEKRARKEAKKQKKKEEMKRQEQPPPPQQQKKTRRMRKKEEGSCSTDLRREPAKFSIWI